MTAYDIEAQAGAAADLAPVAQGGYGQIITLRHIPSGVRDPDTGITTPGAQTDQIGSGIEESYRASDIDGSLIKAGDKRLMISPRATSGALLTQPEVDDLAIYESGQAWTIKSVEPFAPAGNVVFIYLQIRAA